MFYQITWFQGKCYLSCRQNTYPTPPPSSNLYITPLVFLIPNWILRNRGHYSSSIVTVTIFPKPAKGSLSLDHVCLHLYPFNSTLNSCFIHVVIYGTEDDTLIIMFKRMYHVITIKQNKILCIGASLKNMCKSFI